jgi:hypothetical protein
MFSSLSLNNIEKLQVKQLQSILKDGGFTYSFERKELYISKIQKLLKLSEENNNKYDNYEDDFFVIDTKSISDMIDMLIVGTVRGLYQFSDVTVLKSDDEFDTQFKNILKEKGVLSSSVGVMSFDDMLEKISEGIFFSKIIALDRGCDNYKKMTKVVKRYTKCRFITFQSDKSKEIKEKQITFTKNEYKHYVGPFDGKKKPYFSSPEEEYEWSKDQTKKCSKCKKMISLAMFNGNTSGCDPFDKNGYRLRRPECSDCTKICQRSKQEAVKLAKQSGINKSNQVCYICGKSDNIVFDHDYKTNKFRGWLCNEHNRAIGMFGDNVEGLLKAVEYLNKSND